MLSKKDQAIAHGITRPKIVETFYKNTKILDNGCIVWTKMVNENGYGFFGVYSKQFKRSLCVKAHRFAYALAYGFDALPVGKESGDRMVINHICHNRGCVNTNHLEVILQSENTSTEKRKPKND